MIINKNISECEEHDNPTEEKGHEFVSEDWWRKNLFILLKDKNSISETKFQRGESIYKEFIREFFISFNEEEIHLALNLPPRQIITHNIKFIPNSNQEKSYNCVAYTYKSFYEMINNENESSIINTIRSHLVVCIQFLTMLSLHPACIKVNFYFFKKIY